jgi:hypothetical protein
LSATLPKLKLAGETFRSSGLEEEETPLPLRVTVDGGFFAVLIMFKFPLTVPEALGVKLTLTVMLSPVFNVFGKAVPVSTNGPETAILLTVIGLALIFETNTVCAGLE